MLNQIRKAIQEVNIKFSIHSVRLNNKDILSKGYGDTYTVYGRETVDFILDNLDMFQVINYVSSLDLITFELLW